MIKYLQKFQWVWLVQTLHTPHIYATVLEHAVLFRNKTLEHCLTFYYLLSVTCFTCFTCFSVYARHLYVDALVSTREYGFGNCFVDGQHQPLPLLVLSYIPLLAQPLCLSCIALPSCSICSNRCSFLPNLNAHPRIIRCIF